MRGRTVVRRTRWLLLLIPVLLAIRSVAQVGPPPLGPLPPPPVPAGNPITTAKANLGKVLFWDEQLSSSRITACGTCHMGRSGGTDPRSTPLEGTSVHPGNDQVRGPPDDVVGSPGVPLADASGAALLSATFGMDRQVTPRLANSHINAAYSPTLFWDGRADRAFVDPVSGDTVLFANAALESQAAAPPASSVEMGHVGRDWNAVAARVASVQPLALATSVPPALEAWIAGRSYAELFTEAFGTPDITPRRIIMAIATYERTLVSNQSPFDSLIAGQPTSLTPQELAGFQLFGQLPCAGCHGGPLMSDNLFHYIGESPAAEDSGRAGVTHLPQNVGQMRTPSLRNVGLRTSYFHDGRFQRLEDVIAFYNRGGDFNAPNKPPVIAPLGLTPQQQANLVAFLRRAVTDPRVASQAFPFDKPTLWSEARLGPVVEGSGVAGSAGATPVPVGYEPPFAGHPDFTLGVHGALGGASAVLVVDANPPGTLGGIPASGSFARREVVLAGAGAGQGYGSVDLAIPADPALWGQVLYARWYVNDPAGPSGVAASPLLRFTVFGPRGAGLTAVGDTPARPRLLALHASAPNPFRGSGTTMRYDLFAASPVQLTVFDAQGRVVRRLVNERLQLAGTYAVAWDGRDEAGRAVAGGVYFYRLDAGASSVAKRTVKVD